jgi:hypothetical protein
MLDFNWGNWRRTWVVCLALAACENPGIDRDPIENAAGAANGTASASASASDTDAAVNFAATAVVRSSSNEIADAAIRRTRNEVAMPCATSQSAACEGRMAGVYGVEMNLDVYWSDEINSISPAYDAGRGTIKTLLIGELRGLCPGDAEGELVVRVCDLRLPPIYLDSTGGVVQFVLPQAIWDKPGIPEFTARARPVDREHTGFEIVSPVSALLGMQLETSDAVWPSYTDTPFVACLDRKRGADCFPDQDGDGKPGLSLHVELQGMPPSAAAPHAGGWHYTPAPTDAGLPYLGAGATKLFAGLRTTLGGAYPLGPDCNGETGRADAADVSLRVLDCVMVDGAACTPSGATIVDQNMPTFHALHAGDAPPRAWKNLRPAADAALDRSASVGPQNTVMRLGDSGAQLNCADVREVFAARE